jgi:hypothetical protein
MISGRPLDVTILVEINSGVPLRTCVFQLDLRRARSSAPRARSNRASLECVYRWLERTSRCPISSMRLGGDERAQHGLLGF